MSGEYIVCSRCVMDTTAEDITFDENGVCNFCRHYEEVVAKDLYYDASSFSRLESLINQIKKKGAKSDYDCLIGISGGVDSTYVAYLVKKKYGLRPLAVHLDNGWNSELSVSNIEHILKKLDIDLYTHVLDWEEFRDIQISFMKSSVANIEIPTDHAIWALLVRTAAKMKIPYIIAGNNIVTESIMPESWLYGSKDSRFITGIHKKFGKVKMKTYPKLSVFNYVDFLLFRGIRWVPILNYIPYVKEDAKKILINELNWRDYGGKHYESIFTRFFHAYYLPQKFGYDLRKSYHSALILSGQITREEAINDLKLPPAKEEMLQDDKNYVIKKLGFTQGEFDEIMQSPNKTFEDYPNNDSLWRIFGGLISIARKRITRV